MLPLLAGTLCVQMWEWDAFEGYLADATGSTLGTLARVLAVELPFLVGASAGLDPATSGLSRRPSPRLLAQICTCLRSPR